MSYHPRHALSQVQTVGLSDLPALTRDAPSTSRMKATSDGPATHRSNTAPPSKMGLREKMKLAAKVRKYHLAADEMLLMSLVCNVGPPGHCLEDQAPESVYCELHSCRAVLADGSICGNFVGNPTVSRVCKTGWHMENGKFGIVLDLIHKRRALEAVERQKLAEEEAKEAASRPPPFSAWLTSPHIRRRSSSNSGVPSASASTSSASSQGLKTPRSDTGVGEVVEEEAQVEAWWVGRWNVESEPGCMGIPEEQVEVVDEGSGEGLGLTQEGSLSVDQWEDEKQQ